MKDKISNLFLIINIKHLCLMAVSFASIMTLVVSYKDISPWVAAPIVLTGIIFITGLLFSLILKIKTISVTEYVLYSIGLGLSFLVLGGLGVNWILPHIGIYNPLGKIPLLIFFNSSILILSFLAYFFNKNYFVSFNLKWPNKTSLFFGIFPSIFLILSILGSNILNNSGSGFVTLSMLFGIGLYVIVFMFWKGEIEEWVYISALYFIGLSLLFMYSLRSAHVLGWDINLEYQVFQTTLKNLVWKMSYFPGLDYNACLSITILPTIFKVLTNIKDEYVFKIIFQILFALVPVMTYILAKRFLNSKLSFLAAFLFISQTWFFEQMPALIRQETAFIFYLLILLILFNKYLKRITQYILFSIFNITLILSHYSTAYIWFTVFFSLIMLSYLIGFFIKSLNNQSLIIKPMMFFIPLVFLLIWEVPLTSTGGALMKFITHSDLSVPATSTISLLGKSNGDVAIVTSTAVENTSLISIKSIVDIIKSSWRRVLFLEDNQNVDESINFVLNKSLDKRIDLKRYSLYPETEVTNYSLHTVDDRIYLNSKLSKFFSVLVNILVRMSKFIVINIFPLIGIVAVFFGLRRRWSNEEYNFVILNIIAYGFIILMIFTPWLQEYYNFTRLYLQMFITLSILSVVGGIWITKYFMKYQMLVLVFMVVLIFCSLSGAFDQLMGGQTRITLNQPPAIHDTFYTYDAEVAGAHWLSLNRNITLPVQADIIANLRLQSSTRLSSQSFDIFPQTFLRDSYVYLIHNNIFKENTYYLYENNLLVYNYPLDFLNNHKNLIYDSGSSRVYK